MRTRGVIITTILSCCALVSGGARPAAAGATSPAPMELSPSEQDGRAPQVALGANGPALVTWTEAIQMGLPGSADWGYRLQSAIGSAQGAWQSPALVSAPVLPPTQRSNSAVAVDVQGDAVSLWRMNELPAGIIEAAFRPAATGVWGPAAAISAPGEAAAYARAAFDEQGDLFVVWQRLDPGGSRVIAAVRRAKDGRWLPPVAISPAGRSAERANVAVDAQGDAIAAWSSGDAIEVAASRAGANWQPPVVLFSATQVRGARLGDPAVAIGPRGETLVAWGSVVERPDRQRVSTVYAATGSSSGAWSTPAQLSSPVPSTPPPALPPGRFATLGDFSPQTELDQWGNAIVAWQHSVGGDSSAQAAMRIGAEGSWQEPVELSAPGERVNSTPHVAADALGNAIAVWDSGEAVRAAFRAQATVAWFAPVSLSTGREMPYLSQLAMNARGDAIVAWQEAPGGISAIAFNDSSIPAQATERPTISSVRFDHDRFRVAPRRRVRVSSAGAPLGAQLGLTLSVWAKLSIVITSPKASVRRRAACRAPVTPIARGRTSHPRISRGKAERCTRLPLALSPAFPYSPGTTSLGFDGRVGNEALALRPGKYTAVLTATNAAGHSPSVRVPFTIVR